MEMYNASQFPIVNWLYEKSSIKRHSKTARFWIVYTFFFPIITLPHTVYAFEQSSPLHCVSQIEVKSEHLFMFDDWRKIAREKSKTKWQESVKQRYGSVYTIWEVAKNQKEKCERIGFGNDKQGNVGTLVICNRSAEPCVNLIKN